DPAIGAVVPFLANLLHYSDNVEADPIQQDGAADCGPARKHFFQQLPSHHCDPAVFAVVFIVEPAPRTDRNIADLGVSGRNPENLAVGAAEPADRANVFAVQHRRNRAQELGFAANGDIIVVTEVIFLARLQAAFNRGNPAGKGEHDVLAELGQVLLLSAAKALAQSNQQQKRADAPGDPKHGQERAQLVRPQRGQGLPDDIGERSHKCPRSMQCFKLRSDPAPLSSCTNQARKMFPEALGEILFRNSAPALTGTQNSCLRACFNTRVERLERLRKSKEVSVRKRYTLTLLLAAGLCLGAGSAVAQSVTLNLPRASQHAVLMQRVGITDITLNYHRPLVGGRKIWGTVVPFGQVWRAGANENTTIAFTDPVSIEGKPLAAGTYGLHMIPNENSWTVIFSKANASWGSFTYDQKEDALRVDVKPQTADFHEALTYDFDEVKPNAALLTMRWEKSPFPSTSTWIPTRSWRRTCIASFAASRNIPGTVGTMPQISCWRRKSICRRHSNSAIAPFKTKSVTRT